MTKTGYYAMMVVGSMIVLFILACLFAYIAGYVMSFDTGKPHTSVVWGKDTVDSIYNGRFTILRSSSKGRYHLRDSTQPLPLHTEVETYGYEGDDYVVRGGGKTLRIRNGVVIVDGE